MNVPLANAGPHLIIRTVQMLAPPRMMIVPKQNLQEASFMDPKTNLRTYPPNQVSLVQHHSSNQWGPLHQRSDQPNHQHPYNTFHDKQERED